jgi:23S rRNA pseudouridine1911/1915/1917 synthase
MEILYEDNHLIAVNKQVGEIVQADKSGDQPLVERVKEYIKGKYDKPGEVFLGIPHRVDRPVSGVVLFARTSKALERLNRMFQERGEITKIYWAVVASLPTEDEATLVHYLSRDEEKNRTRAHTRPRGDAKEAVLDYRVINRGQRYYLLEVKLHTGRHHQIRCQLSKIGCPIKGDLKYGSPRSNPGGGIHLHARSLSFMHPVKQEPVTIIATPPIKDNLWRFFHENLKENPRSRSTLPNI